MTCYSIAFLASVSPLGSSERPAAFLVKDSAFFNCFVAELLVAMLANPNKPIDLLCVTVPHKYFTLIALVFAKIVLPYDWISIVAALTIAISLHLFRSK